MRKAFPFSPLARLLSRTLTPPQRASVFTINREKLEETPTEPDPKQGYSSFDINNQNHVAKALFQASVKESLKPRISKQDFLQQYPQAVNYVNILVSYGLSENAMMNAIAQTPEILSFDMAKGTQVIKELELHGYEDYQISTIIEKYPYILQYSSKDIENTLNVWKNSGFGERFLIKLFVTYPLFFSLQDMDVKTRLHNINFIMQNKINRTTHLILRNPAVLALNWDKIQEKFDYLYYKMRVSEKEISRAKAVSYPLSHIKIRHTFLDRCGIYVRPSLKDNGLTRHTNPELYEITDTNDEKFARYVAKVSVGEYSVFRQLMKYEKEIDDEDLDPSTTIDRSDFDDTM